MAISTFCSLTPKNPLVITYDPSNPDVSSVTGYIFFYGVLVTHSLDFRLTAQYNNDEIILGGDPVGLSEKTLSNTLNDIIRRSAVYVYFDFNNVSPTKQFLFLFSLTNRGYNPTAQFFVGSDLVRTEQLTDSEEQVAILMDNPGEVSIQVFIRLASDLHYSRMGFKGVDCYLL